VPPGKGTFPAFWILSNKVSRGGGSWPMDGEFDIMEHWGCKPGEVFATIHTGKYNHMKNTQKNGKTQIPNIYNDFHTYVIILLTCSKLYFYSLLKGLFIFMRM
jgi:beta-glucanase (GH16 family)